MPPGALSRKACWTSSAIQPRLGLVAPKDTTAGLQRQYCWPLSSISGGLQASKYSAGLYFEELMIGTHDLGLGEDIGTDIGDIAFDALELPGGGELFFVDTDVGR